MKHLFICVFFLCGFASLSSAVAGQDCEKKTTLTITLPDDVEKAPEVDPERLCVKKNSKFDVVLVAAHDDAEVEIEFPDETPIVKNDGSAKYKEKIPKSGKKLKVKDQCNGDDDSDCEFNYNVYDTTPGSQRPSLDPVIIIER